MWLSVASLLLAGAGIVVCWLAYVRGSVSAANISVRFAMIHRILVNKYYVDEAYQWVIDRLALALARFVAVFDRAVVNDVAVDGPADMVKTSGLRMKFVQTGQNLQLRDGDGGGGGDSGSYLVGCSDLI